MIDGYVRSNVFLRHFVLLITIFCSIVLMTTAIIMTLLLKKYKKYRTVFFFVITMLFWIDSFQNWVVTVTRYSINFKNSFTYLKCAIIMAFTRILDAFILICIFFLVIERLLRLYSPVKHRLFFTKKFVCFYLITINLIICFIIIFGDAYMSLLHINNIYDHVDFCLCSVVLEPTYGLTYFIFFNIILYILLIIFASLLIYKSKKLSKPIEMENLVNPPPYVRFAQDELRSPDYKLGISIGIMGICICIFHLPISIIETLEFMSFLLNNFNLYIPSYVVGIFLFFPIILPVVVTLIFLILNKQLWKDITNILNNINGEVQERVLINIPTNYNQMQTHYYSHI